MRPLTIQPVGDVAPHVRGLAVIRGVPTPVVDAGALFDGGGRAEVSTRFITLATTRGAVALAVDDVIGVRELDARAFDLPSLLSNAQVPAVSSVGMLDRELLVILESARLVPDETWQVLQGTGAA